MSKRDLREQFSGPPSKKGALKKIYGKHSVLLWPRPSWHAHRRLCRCRTEYELQIFLYLLVSMLLPQCGSIFWSQQFVVMDRVIGTLISRALRLGLVSWMMSAQDERQQLDFRWNCAGGMYCQCDVFFYHFFNHNMLSLQEIHIEIWHVCTKTGVTCLMKSKYLNAKARMPHRDGFTTLASALRRLVKMAEIQSGTRIKFWRSWPRRWRKVPSTKMVVGLRLSG